MERLPDKYIKLLEATLNIIRKELDRLHWNKFQHPMKSPFDNTGEIYSNDTFTVRAYYWGDDDSLIPLPNFEYDGIKCYWYKHSGRGLCAYVDNPFDTDYLAKMIDDCYEAMKKDFGERVN